jgi:hypothetical protein
MIVNTSFLMYPVNYIIVLTLPITKPYSLMLLSFTLLKKICSVLALFFLFGAPAYVVLCGKKLF